MEKASEVALDWLDFCFEKLEDVELTPEEDEEMREWVTATRKNLAQFKDDHDKGGIETIFLFLEPIRRIRDAEGITSEQEQKYQQLLHRLNLQMVKIEQLGVQVPPLLKEQIIQAHA